MAYGNSSYGGDSYGGGSGAAQAPTPTTIDVGGAATRAMRTAVGGAVIAPVNDLWANRTVITGTSGSTAFILSNATTEASEPAQAVTTGTGTDWWSWAPGFTGSATVVVPTGLIVDVYLDVDGTLANVLPLAGAPTTATSVTFDARAGETYAIRAYATNPTDSASHTLTWATSTASLDLTLASTDVPWAPSFVTAYLANDVAASTVSLSFDGGATTQTVTTDSEGNVSFPLSIPVLAVGPHTVVAASSSGRTGSATFTLDDADPGFVPPTPPVPPTVVSVPVQRWQLQDPVTGETWEFPTNPATEGATVLPRTLTPHWTVAADGQPLVFEGGRRARPWVLTGHLLTLADKNTLESWQRPYRLYVTDDFGRSFVIKIHRIATQPVLDTLHPEHHSYTLGAYLFGVAP